MNVSTIMTPQPATARGDLALDDALILFDKKTIRHLPIVEGSKLVGVVSDRDLLAATGWLPQRVHACRGPGAIEGLPKRLDQIMQRDVITTGAHETVQSAIVQCVERRIGCLPVVQDGALIGLVTERSLLAAYLDTVPADETRVEECMTTSPTVIGVETTLHQARELCRANGFRHLPIVASGRLLDILSDRDLRRAVGVGRRPDMPIDEIVRPGVVTTGTTKPLARAAKTMLDARISALPVVEDDELVGILSLTDVLDHYLDRHETAG